MGASGTNRGRRTEIGDFGHSCAPGGILRAAVGGEGSRRVGRSSGVANMLDDVPSGVTVGDDGNAKQKIDRATVWRARWQYRPQLRGRAR
jgi:hypothetical protein